MSNENTIENLELQLVELLGDDLLEQLSLGQNIMEWNGVINIGFTSEPDAMIAACVFAKVLITREIPMALFRCDNLIEELEDRNTTNYVLIGHRPKDLEKIPDDVNFLAISKPEPSEPVQNIINIANHELNQVECTLTAISYLMCEGMVSSLMDTLNYITVLPLVAQQTIEMKSEARGVQQIIFQFAKIANLVDQFKTISVLGSNVYSITEALAKSQDPFLPGLTDNEDKVTEFLARLDINPETREGYRQFSELSFEELKKVNTELAIYLSKHSKLKLESLNFIAEKTVIQQEFEDTILYNTWDFARAILDTINRDQITLGLSVILGNRGNKLSKLRKVYEEERQSFLTSYDFLFDKRENIISLDHLNYLETDKKVSWYNAALIAGMMIASGLGDNKVPFLLVVPGPGNNYTIGGKASKNVFQEEGLLDMMQKVTEERDFDIRLSGDTYEVQCIVPKEEWEGILLDLNNVLGELKS